MTSQDKDEQIQYPKKPPTKALYGLALAFIFGIALFLRTYFPYENVFTGDWVRFQYYDSWYHVRLVENLVQHFPQRIFFDPYTFYPHGLSVFFAPFYDLLLGSFAWVFGLGSPSRETIETVAAYFPAIMGALVTIPVYFIGKELFNKKVGLIAAALIAILPGQFLIRSLLGFTDHHVAETLFSSLTILFLILAVKSSKHKEISFNSLLARDWGTLRKPLIYSALTGIALGFYLLSWVGGSLLVLVIFVFALAQYIIDHLRGRPTDYLCIIIAPSFLIALLMITPFLGQFGMGNIQVASLLIGMMALPALSGASLLMTRRNMRRVYYPLAIAILTGIGLAFFHLIDPSLLNSMLQQLGILDPAGGPLTISEVKPLSLARAWDEFNTGFYLALISLAVVAYLVVRKGAADKTLLLVWSAIMLMVTFGQNRFAYYFAVNVAILTAYLSWKIPALVSTRITFESGKKGEIDESAELQTGTGRTKSSKKAKRKKARAPKMRRGTLTTWHPATRYALAIIAVAAVFFLVFYPNIGRAIDTARLVSPPTQDWYDSLVWMRENTPDPFQDTDFYYGQYESPPVRKSYNYPESAYGVMSWWDYGHWITYIAHRIPNSNPHQAGARNAASFFTAQDESTANGLLDKLGSKYVIIDSPMATYRLTQDDHLVGKFYAIIGWTDKDRSEFFEIYYIRNEAGKLDPLFLYHPEYYRSMSSRLYLFEGEEVIPDNSTWVISYTERPGQIVDKYKEISSMRRFATYEEAEAFLELQDSSNYRIVGTDPLFSPVPLEELEHYKLIYKSPTTVTTRGDETISEVEIFEYTP